MAEKKELEQKVVAQNRKAYHDYFIDDRVEAGIVLVGSEVKALRLGRSTIAEAHAGPMGDDLYLFNLYIPEFKQAHQFNHEARRPRKLLLRRREIAKLLGTVQRKGMTLVPLSLYFSTKGWAKVELGIARGKKDHDKRASEKAKDWDRERERLLRA